MTQLIEIIAVSASTACLIVWAALCIAFIRYHSWYVPSDPSLNPQLANPTLHQAQKM